MVIRRWFGDGSRSYSSWALWGFERGRPRGSLPSALRHVVLFFPLGFLRVRRLGGGGRRVAPLPPSVLRCLPRGVSPCFPVGVPAPGCLAGSRGSLGLAAASSWPSACPSFPGFVFEELVYGIFADFDEVSYFGRFPAAFSELRGARQVERFTACSFRHLPHVVLSSWRVASEFFFLVFAAPDPGGC